MLRQGETEQEGEMEGGREIQRKGNGDEREKVRERERR